MRSSTSRFPHLVGALTAALVLAACGSSGGTGGSDGGDADGKKDSPPSKADFAEAKTALADLKTDYQAVYDAGAQLQKTSIAYFRGHPSGTAEDADLQPAATAFDAAVQKRDDASAEVAKLPALKDPEVAQAYETFTAKAAKGDPYHVSLYAAFPLLEQVLTACGDVFTSTKTETSPKSAAQLGRRMLAAYTPAIADCLPALDELSDSDNADLAAYGDGFTTIVTQRKALLTRLSTDDISMDDFSTQYKRVAGQVKVVGQHLEFQKQLNALSPVPEFLALEKVVAGKAA